MSLPGARVNRMSDGSSAALQYWRLSRPFTLVAPAVGIVSGGVIALGAKGGLFAPGSVGDTTALGAEGIGGPAFDAVLNIICGAAVASALNAASNAVNQIFDVETDRINRPFRPLPAGKVSVQGAALFAAILTAAALATAWTIRSPDGGRSLFIIVTAATIATAAYSVPPLRFKRWWFTANPTIAVTRGLLLVVAGWSTVREPWNPEPWFIGAVMGLFVLGACTTKDYADVEGDRLVGCMTLPVRFGPRLAAVMTAPFFVVPFFLVPLGISLGVLTGNARILGVVWPLLCVAGFAMAVVNVIRGGRAVWAGMYLMMITAQVGFALAYVFY